MKRIIMLTMVLVMMFVSLGGCFGDLMTVAGAEDMVETEDMVVAETAAETTETAIRR